MQPGVFLAAGLLLVGTAAAAAIGVARDDDTAPAVTRWIAVGDAALAGKHAAEAIDAYEAALALDPKSAAAFTGMAHAYAVEGLPGRAIKYYREALALQPNDLGALEGQGEALVARGATTRARVNLDRIRTLCKGDCPAAKKLETALAAPPPVAVTPTPLASADTAKAPVGKP